MKITAFRISKVYNTSLKEKAQEIGFKYGYSYYYTDKKLRLDNDIIVYIFYKYNNEYKTKKLINCLTSILNYNNTRLIRILTQLYEPLDNTLNDDDITIIDDDLKALENELNDTKPNYNTTKELVYENKKSIYTSLIAFIKNKNKPND